MMTLLGFGGVFAAITYLSPMLTEVTGVSNQAISWFMVLLGLGMMVGNYFGGKFADKNLFLALAGSLALLTVALLAFGWVLKSAILSGLVLLLIGAIGFATVPPLQMMTMVEAKTAPTLISAHLTLGTRLLLGWEGSRLTLRGALRAPRGWGR